MEMPEGWKKADQDANDYEGLTELKYAMILMKQMAEALEQTIERAEGFAHADAYKILKKFKEWK